MGNASLSGTSFRAIVWARILGPVGVAYHENGGFVSPPAFKVLDKRDCRVVVPPSPRSVFTKINIDGRKQFCSGLLATSDGLPFLLLWKTSDYLKQTCLIFEKASRQLFKC